MARMAYNPLPFSLTAEGWKPELAPPLREILKIVKDAGYDGIHAEVPQGSTPEQYAAALKEHALQPAPGYFSASFSDKEHLTKTVEAARTIASEHAKLGLDRIFIAEQFGAAPERLQTPAIGVGSDPDRLARIAEGLSAVGGAMIAEGVVPCLHPHVGTLIETVEETEFVLDRIDPAVMMVGPDTVHLSWAGADLNAFLARHVSRVGAVHIKDYRREVAETGKSYHEAGAAHIWTEPGRGSIDLEGALASLAGFDGWFVVEVDIADQPTVAQSADVAARWLRPRLEARAVS